MIFNHSLSSSSSNCGPSFDTAKNRFYITFVLTAVSVNCILYNCYHCLHFLSFLYLLHIFVFFNTRIDDLRSEDVMLFTGCKACIVIVIPRYIDDLGL